MAIDKQATLDALKLINPTPERRAECEREIDLAVRAVKSCEQFDAFPGPGTRKAELLKIAATLLEVQIEGEGWLDDSFIAEVKRQRKDVEKQARKIFVEKKGKPRQSVQRSTAVHFAQTLLVAFGKPRGLSREGPWHRLARALFEMAGGKTSADLFKYMQQQFGDRAQVKENVLSWENEKAKAKNTVG